MHIWYSLCIGPVETVTIENVLYGLHSIYVKPEAGNVKDIRKKNKTKQNKKVISPITMNDTKILHFFVSPLKEIELKMST